MLLNAPPWLNKVLFTRSLVRKVRHFAHRKIYRDRRIIRMVEIKHYCNVGNGEGLRAINLPCFPFFSSSSDNKVRFDDTKSCTLLKNSGIVTSSTLQ